ncbi:T9SS type A sorting domain-containing protein [Flaviramulus sp. BrNp1-15]|uniref:T9SS type A sorting domain-containing protein n=1 Tax=Flaviramulus sp. BrNp1-15 TaxID=2916754 RepID=UPI001EE8552B|nr:T9SS type A sorting domain-containing protein [Flaviramulus sp. BrNp1-15]ULC59970.1 T9SS type A sorting domain-containing protein [Flaviramulus sp. BrNp1-15]
MKPNPLLKVFFVLSYLVPTLVINAQIGLKELSLEKQIQNSNTVVEGKVKSKKSFWNAQDGLIYTANTIEVYKVFKGKSVSTIDVITLGGTVGLKALIANPSLKLQVGDIGVFTLIENDDLSPTTKSDSVLKQFKPYGSIQGFYKYNLYSDVAVNPFNKKQGIKSSFYSEIMSFIKKQYVEVEVFDAVNKTSVFNKGSLFVPSGIAFSPTTASAGTGTVLTITGSDFGGTTGTVWFSNADDGGATFVSALGTQVLSWSDTQITVEIPSNAGTGPIMVEDAVSASAVSAASLTVSYAEINVIYDANGTIPPEAYPVQHVDINGSGGYTLEMFTDFFDNSEHDGAKVAFESALNEWVCQSGVNWVISGSATSVDIVDYESDPTGANGAPVNVIRFDNGSELDTNVLGVCYSWYSGCGGAGGIDWYVGEMDIVFDSETNWHFDTGLPEFSEYDFQSVALHELGHGHQLGHVIDVVSDGDNLDDVMHYAISNSEQQRVLSANNIIAANDVQSRSTSLMVCGQSLMTDASCPLSIAEEELKQAITLYPNPARNEVFIKNDSFINLDKAVIYDISGRLVSEYDLSNTVRTKPISLIGVSRGIYFVKIHSERAFVTKKIILE